jgi:hypothetical protein
MKQFPRVPFRLVALMAGAALATACGSDEKKAPAVDAFIGTWNVGQAAVAVTCPPLGPQSGAFAGVVNIAKGQGADLAMTFTDSSLAGCTLRFNLQSDASAVPVTGQSCAVSLQGIMATFTVASGTFGIVANAGSLSLKGGAAVKFGNLDLTCTGDVTGMLTRGAPTDAGADAI